MQWSHYCVCCTLTPCNIPSFCPGLSSPLLSTTQNPYISSLTRNGWKLSHLRRQNCWFMSSVSNRATRSSSLGFRKNWTSDLLNCWYWSIIQLFKALKASWDGGENIWGERKLFVPRRWLTVIIVSLGEDNTIAGLTLDPSSLFLYLRIWLII